MALNAASKTRNVAPALGSLFCLYIAAMVIDHFLYNRPARLCLDIHSGRAIVEISGKS